MKEFNFDMTVTEAKANEIASLLREILDARVELCFDYMWPNFNVVIENDAFVSTFEAWLQAKGFDLDDVRV